MNFIILYHEILVCLWYGNDRPSLVSCRKRCELKTISMSL